jgi:RHS repeat-associated protein
MRRYFDEGELADGAKLYYAQDHLGSVRDVVDANSHTLASYDYDPYGQPTRTTGAAHTDFRYAGLLLHYPSGLYLANYRAYDPASGRWLSRDPIGEEGGINLYAYVGVDPVNSTDTLGLCGPACVIAAGAVVGGVSSAVGTLIGGGSISDAISSIPGGSLAGATAVTIAMLSPGSVVGTLGAIIGDVGITAGLNIIDVAGVISVGNNSSASKQCHKNE